MEVVVILKHHSRDSNVGVFLCQDGQKCSIPVVEGGVLILFSQYSVTPNLLFSSLNILLLKMEMAECHKGRLGLSGYSWALFYK